MQFCTILLVEIVDPEGPRAGVGDWLPFELVFVPDVTRVLGIDPGLTRCGYAVVDGRGANAESAVAMGVIRTPPDQPLPQRLATLGTELAALIAEFEPDVVAVEHVFFQVNVRTAMSVGQASGLALAEAARAGCEVAQYTPNQVKDAVAGWAAALALCHLAMAPMRARISDAARTRRPA